MSINANNAALNEILETINNLPSTDGLNGDTVYTNIVYNDDNTVTLTDKDGVDHTMVCEYTDGVLSGLTYDGKSVELTYEEDGLVNIGAIEVDMANVPYESGGGGTEDIENIIDASGVLDSTDGTVEDKVEQLVDKAKDESLWYNHFKKHGYNYSSTWGFFNSYEEATLPNIDVSTFRSMSHFCANSKVERIDFYLNSEKSTSHLNCFYNTPLLTFVKGVNTSNSTNVNGMLAESAIEVIEEPLDLSKATSANYFTNSTVKLREIRIVPETIKISITFGTCLLLSAESIQSIIDGLAYVSTSQNLTLSNQITVTDNQKQVINAKGWTLIQ